MGHVHVCRDIKSPGCILFLLHDTTFLRLLWETGIVKNGLRPYVDYWVWKITPISYIKGNFLVESRTFQALDSKMWFFGSLYFIFYYVPHSKLKYTWISEPWNFFSRNCLTCSDRCNDLSMTEALLLFIFIFLLYWFFSMVKRLHVFSA